LFDYNSRGQQIYRLYAKEADNKNDGKEFPYGLKTKDYTLIERNEFWPNGWEIPNQTLKPCAYWPLKYYFLYIMNGKIFEEKPVLATNSIGRISELIIISQDLKERFLRLLFGG
jgi:hypothetical protein